LEALLWPLRSSTFWLPCLLWLTLGAALLFLADSDEAELVVMSVSLIALLATPFLCMNPSTLDAPSLSRWWRPGWPGWAALRGCLMIWIICTATSFILDKLSDAASVVRLNLLLWVLDQLISSIAFVLIIAIWLNRGHMHGVRMDLARIAWSGFIGEFVWQSALIAVAFAYWPFLSLWRWSNWYSSASISAVERTTGGQLPFWLRLLSRPRPEGLALLMLAAVPSGLYFGFAQGRFDAPTRGRLGIRSG